LNLSLVLSNLGEKEGIFDIQVAVDGVVEQRDKVRISGQTSKQITLPLKGRPAGTYIIEVNGSKMQVVVAPEYTPSQVSSEPSQEKVYVLEVAPEKKDRRWIFFIALGWALLLVGITLYGLLRWERATRPRE